MRALYVEDNRLNQLVMGALLSALQVEMVVADDAEAGLEALDGTSFDLVLMDLRMPKMDGLEAVRRIRARPDARSKVPIVVVTADAAANVRRDCEEAGADGVVLKPIDRSVLIKTLSRVLVNVS